MEQLEGDFFDVIERQKAAVPKRKIAAGSGKAELELFDRIRHGDEVAFDQLYSSYHPRLTRFLMNLVRRPLLVEEVLNDTMMVVWERPDSFSGASKLSTWVFAIAYRKAMKGLRRLDEPIEDHNAEERASLDDSPEDVTRHYRRRKLLIEAMNELSPAHRAVVDLTYFNELDYNEIAVILDCPVGTVKTRMFHARRQLKRRLSGEFADWL